MAVDQKQRMIEIHHEQIDLFQERCEQLQQNPYSSAFAYGRRALGKRIVQRYETFYMSLVKES